MKKKLNVKLLRKIQKHITEEPKRYDQFCVVKESHFVPCGTVACIAGWANILTGVKPHSDVAQDLDRAARRLGIRTYGDLFPIGYGGFHFLFDLNGWPSRFEAEYAKAKTPKTRAKIACERIDHLIATGE